MLIRHVQPDELYQLRMSVLIVGTNRTSPQFQGDLEPDAHHLGAFDGERIIGCASFIPSEWMGLPAWQLRGMATDPQYLGKGVGSAVLRYGEETLRSCGRSVLWCNARTSAVGFYLKQGWKIVSDEFVISDVGPHFKMMKDLILQGEPPCLESKLMD
jgi:predicted GNAT family N-acyltransferase